MFYIQSLRCVIITIFISSHYYNVVDASPNIVTALSTASKKMGYNTSSTDLEETSRKENFQKGEYNWCIHVDLKDCLEPEVEEACPEVCKSNSINKPWCIHVDLKDCLEPAVIKACPEVCKPNTPGDAYWCEDSVKGDDCLQTEVMKACPLTCMQMIDKEWCQWVVDDLDDCEKPEIQNECPAKCKSLGMSPPIAKDESWCKWTVQLPDCNTEKIIKSCPIFCIYLYQIDNMSAQPDARNEHAPRKEPIISLDANWCEHAVKGDDCLHTEVKKACPLTCMQEIDKEWCQWVVVDLDDCEKSEIQKECPAKCESLGVSPPIVEDEPWCQWAVQLPECDNEFISESCPKFCASVSPISPGLECGKIQDKQRIVGGQNSAVNEYPWIVGFYRKYVFHCGGTLISKVWILTASHCFRHGGVNDFLITVGDHDLRSDDEVNHVLRNLSVVITHTKFDNPIPYACDIALAKMSEPVTFNHKIAPICLPSLDSDTVDYEDIEATIIGWGATNSGQSGANILQEATVTTMSSEKCRKSRTRNWLYRIIREDWICAHRKEGGIDACQGDSGGPMMAIEDDHWVQIGVTSWGNGCALKNNPGVYTKVSSFMDWIDTNTNEDTWCTEGSDAVCYEREING